MSSLLSRIVRVVDDEVAKFRKDGQWWTVRKVFLTIEVDDDVGEVGFVNELEELLRKYNKDVKISVEAEIWIDGLGWVTEEDLRDIEADMVRKLEMEMGAKTL